MRLLTAGTLVQSQPGEGGLAPRNGIAGEFELSHWKERVTQYVVHFPLCMELVAPFAGGAR